MEISNEQITWSSENISVFRQFLKTETGSKLIPKLLENAPPLLKRGAINSILIRNGEVAAWGECVQALLSLSAPEPKAPDQSLHSNQYPDPTDDSAWNDGKKTQ